MCRIDCIVYCGGGGVVMERFIGAINRISGDKTTQSMHLINEVEKVCTISEYLKQNFAQSRSA